jgi:hypothetical protein
LPRLVVSAAEYGAAWARRNTHFGHECEVVVRYFEAADGHRHRLGRDPASRKLEAVFLKDGLTPDQIRGLVVYGAAIAPVPLSFDVVWIRATQAPGDALSTALHEVAHLYWGGVLPPRRRDPARAPGHRAVHLQGRPAPRAARRRDRPLPSRARVVSAPGRNDETSPEPRRGAPTARKHPLD